MSASLRESLTRPVKLTHAERVKDALTRGEADARLLDGRDFDAAYWRQAKRSFSVLLREQEKTRGERDALRAVIDRAV